MNTADNSDIINLGNIVNVLLSHSRLIILVTSFFAVTSVLYALSLNNIYQSYATIYVDDPAGTKFSGGSNSGLNSLASLAGVSIDSGNQKEDKVQLVLTMLKSYKLAEELLKNNDILPALMATKKIDPSSGQIIFNNKIYNSDLKQWLDKDKNFISGPSAPDVYKALGRSLKASYSKRTGFLTVSIEHESPLFAKQLLDSILSNIDTSIRTRDELDAENSIKFLKGELETITGGELRAAVSALIQRELQKTVLAKRNSSYILRYVQPPFLPFEKIRPSRAMICIMGTFLGFILACSWCLFAKTREA